MGSHLPTAGSRGGGQLGTIVFLIAVILVAGVVIAQYWPWRPDAERRPDSRSSSVLTSSTGSAQERTAKYVGQASCSECHPGESALQRRSGHARTLGLAAQSPIIEWLNGKSKSDPNYPDIQWSYQVRDKRLVVDRTRGVGTDSLLLDYAVGSGKHGVTFVAVQDGKTESGPTGIEHRVSYLASSPRLAITPGQEGSQRDPHDSVAAERVGFGHRMGVDQLRQCFGCHSTVTSTAAPGLLDIATLLPNVSCERCHGPAGDHVDAAQGRNRLDHADGTRTCTTRGRGQSVRPMPSGSPIGLRTVDQPRQSRDRPVSRCRHNDVGVLCQGRGKSALYDLPRSPRPRFGRSPLLRRGLSIVPSISPGAKGLSDLARCQLCRLSYAATRDPRQRRLHGSLDSQTRVHPQPFRRKSSRRDSLGTWHDIPCTGRYIPFIIMELRPCGNCFRHSFAHEA